MSVVRAQLRLTAHAILFTLWPALYKGMPYQSQTGHYLADKIVVGAIIIAILIWFGPMTWISLAIATFIGWCIKEHYNDLNYDQSASICFDKKKVELKLVRRDGDDCTKCGSPWDNIDTKLDKDSLEDEDKEFYLTNLRLVCRNCKKAVAEPWIAEILKSKNTKLTYDLDREKGIDE
jgi:hypothetical protein